MRMKTDAGEEEAKQHKYHSRNVSELQPRRNGQKS
jgi:hypothetical protein